MLTSQCLACKNPKPSTQQYITIKVNEDFTLSGSLNCWFMHFLWLCVAMLGLDISWVFIRRCADSFGWWVWPHVSQRLWESGEETQRRTTKTERTGATERNWGEREVRIHDFSMNLFWKCCQYLLYLLMDWPLWIFLMTDASILETTTQIYMISEYLV